MIDTLPAWFAFPVTIAGWAYLTLELTAYLHHRKNTNGR